MDRSFEVKRNCHLGKKLGVQLQGDFIFVEDDKGASVILAASSLTRLANVMTIKITFREKWARDQVVKDSKDSLVRARTRLRSQEGVGFCTDGKTSSRLQRKEAVVGWSEGEEPIHRREEGAER